MIKLGLYRHFKGEYYFLLNIVRGDNERYVQYLNIFHPEYGYFVRPYSEWRTDVSEREDNITGQTYRFERVYSIDNAVKNLSTNQLIDELKERSDSPLQKLDIEGLSAKCFNSDYVVGEAYEATEDSPKGVYTVAVCDTPQEAFDYLSTHSTKKNTGVFKRTFIQLENGEFDLF